MTAVCLTSVTLGITILEHLSEIFIIPHIFNLGGTVTHNVSFSEEVNGLPLFQILN